MSALLWWSLLCLAAAVNVVAWVVSARLVARRAPQWPQEVRATRRALLWLAAVYVAGCAFRSVLPMIDVPRYCLHDTWMSRIFVGRSVATLAELAFVAQWALLMREAGAVRAARAVVPIIVAAETLSWFAVLTTNDLFHAAENAVWTVAAGFAAAFLASRWRYEEALGRRVIVAALGCAGAYIAFMAAYVVPMYLARWQPHRAYLSLEEGMGQILQRCTVERDWALWWQDAAWLSPYFTAAVWISLALAQVPSLRPAGASAAPRRG
ncbi:MAG TPA: hypothetical protein VKE95_11830 [Burkholderiales bacterium]|nr:hypothetical protein [Burkholderiales bacterium]